MNRDETPDEGRSDEPGAGAETIAPEQQIGVVLMAYGTPSSPEQVLEYYTDIRRGRPPTDEQLADLTARYEAIGGLSPLAARTEAQRTAIQAKLDEIDAGRYRVVLGLKHAEPKIEQAVADLAGEGIRQIVGFVLAPHFSTMSVGTYNARLVAAAESFGIEVATIESWADDQSFVDFVADDLQRRIDAMDGQARVIFTAHSLPQRILEEGDPYPDQLRLTATTIASAVGLDEGTDWELAWQSAGRTPEPWLGPDVLDVIDRLSTEPARPDGVIVSAVGFVSDHLEVLYDLDIEARDVAEQHGLRFDRTMCVNDDDEVMGSLATMIDALATSQFHRE